MVRWSLPAMVALLVLSACADGSRTDVAMTLAPTVGVAPEGKHYELFASVNESAVSLLTFDVEVRSLGEGVFERAVLDHLDPTRELGLVDGVGADGSPVSGVRFTVPVNLTGATEIFITLEDDGETDPAPTRDVLMACRLAEEAAGTLGCILRAPAPASTVRGTITLVPPPDGVNPL